MVPETLSSSAVQVNDNIITELTNLYKREFDIYLPENDA
jgi:hypothetical protein